MDKDRVKGKGKDIAGRIQRRVGEWTADEEQQVKGAAKQAEGKVQNVAGKVKDAARDLARKVREEREHQHTEEDRAGRKRVASTLDGLGKIATLRFESPAERHGDSKL